MEGAEEMQNLLALLLFLIPEADEIKISPQKNAGFEESSYLCSTSTRQASQRCSNVRVVLFLYISLAEILVFSNDSYFFVNIENMEENGNMLIIKELWICWLIALK